MPERFTLPHFEYEAPRSLSDAVRLLRKYRRSASILAGGTTLLVDVRGGRKPPKMLVDIGRLWDLEFIKFSGRTGLRVGALTKLESLEKSELTQENYPAIADAARGMGTVQIRNMATVGGNLCSGSPFSDLAVPLLALGSELVLRGHGKERAVKMEEFYAGPYKTRLKPSEILTEIRIPHLKNCGMAFMRFGRTAVDLGLAKVALALKMDGKQKCSLFRLAIGTATKIPKRIVNAEKLLTGKTLDGSWSDQIAKVIEGEEYVEDWRASSEYRKELCKVLTKRALDKAIEMAGGR